MDEKQALEAVRALIISALEERRGLVAFSRLEAVEMDRRARTLEREVLDQLRGLLPPLPADEHLHGVKIRLQRMEEHLEALAGRTEIQERSRSLEQDDIRWRAFEDISWLLGIG